MNSRQLKLLVHVVGVFSNLISQEDWSYWESRMSFIEIPVCLVWGEHDNLYDASEPERMRRVFKNSELVHIDGAGHLAMSDAPEKVANMMEIFFKRVNKLAS